MTKHSCQVTANTKKINCGLRIMSNACHIARILITAGKVVILSVYDRYNACSKLNEIFEFIGGNNASCCVNTNITMKTICTDRY